MTNNLANQKVVVFSMQAKSQYYEQYANKKGFLIDFSLKLLNCFLSGIGWQVGFVNLFSKT